jgi:hypothetical protein
MNQEADMTETNIPELTPALGRIRAELMTAVARDRSRAARRRRRGLLAALAVVAAAGVGSAIAAATGAFTPAPPQVKQTFEDLNSGPDAPGVDASRAVQIGVIDEHPAYAAPTAGGGFCLYFAPNPGRVQRSGPSGSVCTASEPGPSEIVFSPQQGHDGGFVFGRVGTDDAMTVEIVLPNGTGTIRTPVVEDRFFLADLPQRALDALSRGATLTATATNADGGTVARSVEPSLAEPGRPTETGPVPKNDAERRRAVASD